jgi:hypothetical protein
MNIKRNIYPLIVGFVAVALLVGSLVGIQPNTVQGAPAAIPTPITQFMRQPAPKVINFWSTATALTADTRSCVNIDGYNTLDLHWIIDQGTVNTTTLTLQFSNITDSYVNGVAVATNNAADSTDLNQFQVFGRNVCLHANLTNSNAFTLTAVGLAK